MNRVVQTLLVTLFLIVGCSKQDIVGRYEKMSGAGGAIDFDSMLIERLGNDYSVAMLNNGGAVLRYKATISENGVLLWTDKFLPMAIEFSGENATLKVGGGSFGYYKFVKKR